MQPISKIILLSEVKPRNKFDGKVIAHDLEFRGDFILRMTRMRVLRREAELTASGKPGCRKIESSAEALLMD
jgi:hypothetical protein